MTENQLLKKHIRHLEEEIEFLRATVWEMVKELPQENNLEILENINRQIGEPDL